MARYLPVGALPADPVVAPEPVVPVVPVVGDVWPLWPAPLPAGPAVAWPQITGIVVATAKRV